MKIGIDCRTILKQGKDGAGIEHYVFYLVKNVVSAFAKDDSISLKLFVKSGYKGLDVYKKSEKTDIVEIPEFGKGFFSSIKKHKELAEFFDSQNLDLIHFPVTNAPRGLRTKFIATVHDLAIYENPEWFPSGQWYSKKVLVPNSIKNSAGIIAVSEDTKDQALRIFKIAEKKVEVIHEGIEDKEELSSDFISSIQNKFGTGGKFILYVGTIEPRKNIERLIRAFEKTEEYDSHTEGYKLVLAGKKGWKYDKIIKAFENSKMKDNIIFTGYISKQEKQALYSSCEIFIFPSLSEGFGLPVLEAMNFGCPVIASDIPSLKEICGNAVYYIDPLDIESIAKGIIAVISDVNLQSGLKERGVVQSSKFSWRETAKKTVKFYKKLEINSVIH